MKRNYLLAIAVGLFICMVLDFMALHDIQNDYVSQAVIDRFTPGTSDVLPDWTSTPTEWGIVTFSYYVKLFIIIILFLVPTLIEKLSYKE